MSSLECRKARLAFDKKIIEIRELIVEAQEISHNEGLGMSVINEVFDSWEIEKACRNCS